VYAERGQRGWATLIDMAIAISVLAIPVIFLSATGAGSTTHVNSAGKVVSVQSSLGIVVIVVGCLALFAMAIWRIASEGRTGQWVGKRLLKIRLVSATTGQPIGFFQSLWRQRVYGPYSAKSFSVREKLLRPLHGPMSQTIADLAYGTVVVRVAAIGPSVPLGEPQDFAELAARQKYAPVPAAPVAQAAPVPPMVRAAPMVPVPPVQPVPRMVPVAPMVPVPPVRPVPPMVQVAPTVPAAWFPDPSGARGLRWWNGVAWTEHTRPAG
jgi:uncharacterized RDD family membrane protein YckC